MAVLLTATATGKERITGSIVPDAGKSPGCWGHCSGLLGDRQAVCAKTKGPAGVRGPASFVSIEETPAAPAGVAAESIRPAFRSVDRLKPLDRKVRIARDGIPGFCLARGHGSILPCKVHAHFPERQNKQARYRNCDCNGDGSPHVTLRAGGVPV
jgi:hypothetical protein